MTLSKIREDGDLVLALGSNLGDRGEYIKRALSLLEEVFGTPVEVTEVIESQAVGFIGPDFLNCIAGYRNVRFHPHEVLDICKKIERQLGRTDTPEYREDGSRIYHSRCIDIDILFYGNRVVDDPDLKIPHPGVYSRGYLQDLLSKLMISF